MNPDSSAAAPAAQTLREVMTTDVVSVAPSTLIEAALDVMLEHEISGLPVIEKGRLIGIISEFDALRLLLETGEEPELILPVAHYMSTDVMSVPEHTPLETVAQIFRHIKLRRLPVVRDGKVVGIVSRRDLIRVVRERRRSHGFEVFDDDDWRTWLYTMA